MSVKKMKHMMGCVECGAMRCQEVIKESAKYKCKNCGKVFEINYCQLKNGNLCFYYEFGLCDNCLNILEFIDYCKRQKYGVRFKEKDEKYKELEEKLAFNEDEVIYKKNIKGDNIMNNKEEVREFYKPNNVKVLFVGESIPTGGTFFYNENSHLYRNTEKAFERENIIFSLDKFAELGCWLYDVCKVPVDKLTKKEKLKNIKAGIPALFNTIKELNPEYIIVVKMGEMKEIVYTEICKEFSNKYIDGKTAFNLPFPACGRQKEYKTGLTQIISQIYKQGEEMKIKIKQVIDLLNKNKIMEYIVKNNYGFYNYDERLIRVLIDMSFACDYIADYKLIENKNIEEYSLTECKTFATWLNNGERICDGLIANAIEGNAILKLLKRYLELC